jgi:predicted alpha/beta hydrolase
MASRRIWNSRRESGFAATLAEQGIRTLALDFRGHGESGTPAARGGIWTFDELAREDLPALSRAARERWPRDRLTLVGHSLGGQAALAALATNIWLPGEEPNPFLRARKASIVRLMRGITRARGYFPARALGIGSDDECAPYMEGWARHWDRDAWHSDDDTVDYFAALGRIELPVLAIASVGDRSLCTPQAAFRFIGRVRRASVRFELIRRADDGSAPPDHMEMVTTARAASSWHEVAKFCLG